MTLKTSIQNEPSLSFLISLPLSNHPRYAAKLQGILIALLQIVRADTPVRRHLTRSGPAGGGVVVGGGYATLAAEVGLFSTAEPGMGDAKASLSSCRRIAQIAKLDTLIG